MDEISLSIFVYGTLKRGERNHDRFCAGALGIDAAATPGHLYELPFGFPGLRVPEGNIHAVGTTDYASDARRQRRQPSLPGDVPAGWDAVHGELVIFDDPARLGALDALEGYAPGERGLYERVLIPVETDSGNVLAWAYGIKRSSGVHLPDGRWPA